MALTPHAKNQMASAFRVNVRHFQIYGTYYPQGLGNSSVGYPTEAVTDASFKGTSNSQTQAWNLSNNVLALADDYLPTSGEAQALVWDVDVATGAVLDIQGIRLWSGSVGNFSQYNFDRTDPDVSNVVFEYQFPNPVRFSSAGEFSITGFQLTIN